MHIRISSRLTSHRRQAASERGGATAVEFALVAPIFVIFLIACFEFSRLYMIRHTADNAAYASAREAMVPGATAQDAINEARRLLDIIATDGEQIVITPAQLNDDVAEVRVTIRVPFDQNAFLIPRFAKNLTLTSSATLKTERYNAMPN